MVALLLVVVVGVGLLLGSLVQLVWPGHVLRQAPGGCLQQLHLPGSLHKQQVEEVGQGGVG